MKLGVTTLGCPDWTLEQILTRLPQYGYQGVELRGLGSDLELTETPDFTTLTGRRETRRRFADAGLEICAVDSSARFADTESEAQAKNLKMAQQAIELANALGASSVRVFGGSIPEGENRAEVVARVADSLRQLGEFAARETRNVTVVLETHDSFSTGAQAAEVLALTAHPRVAALWDLHHPFRQGETPGETISALRPYVRMTHLKDSNPGGTYCLLGEGDVPIMEMLRLLSAAGYDGYLNLEWEKRWLPQLAEPEIAFPQYSRVLRDYLTHL